MTNEEKETIIIWNEKDSTAKIFTYNKKIKNKLRRYSEAIMESFSSDGSEQWVVPKKMIHIYSRKATPEQKKRMSELGKQLHKREDKNENI